MKDYIKHRCEDCKIDLDTYEAWVLHYDANHTLRVKGMLTIEDKDIDKGIRDILDGKVKEV